MGYFAHFTLKISTHTGNISYICGVITFVTMQI
nr:MAG TPA: hypothetical protein [Caudoviricetes sp.]